MTYGNSPFGTTPFGGLSLESGGVSIASANPAIDGTSAPVNTHVQVVLHSISEFEAFTLQFFLDGVQVIQDDAFLPPFTGTVVNEGGDLTIDVAGHPDFADGNTVQVDISVMTLGGDTANLSYVFHTGGAVFDGAENFSIGEDLRFGQHTRVEEALAIEEGISPFIANATENLTQTVNVAFDFNVTVQSETVLQLFESLQIGSLRFYSIDETTVGVEFPEVMDLEGVSDPNTYLITPREPKAFPTIIGSATPIQDVFQEGATGQVIPPAEFDNNRTTSSFVFDTVTGSFLPKNIGDYFYISGTMFNPLAAYRIISYSGSRVTLDQALPYTDPANGTYVPPGSPWSPGTFVPGTGTIRWSHQDGARGATLKVTETSLGRTYFGQVTRLTKKAGHTFYSGGVEFVAFGSKPRVISAFTVADDGSVIVSFTKDMRIDQDLLNPEEYVIVGPSSEQVRIREVRAIDPKTVILFTSGMGEGIHHLTVNASGTPKDEAGNHIDPFFNQLHFVGTIPLLTRSVFTDRGPIAKPALDLQTGTGGTIQTAPSLHFGNLTLSEVVLPGGSFNSTHVGKYLELGGSTSNSGNYRVVGVVNQTRLKLQANFHLPDPANGALSWRLYDPRTGEIADAPADVTVKVNGHRVAVQAVVGLLGQVVLDSPPAHEADVKIDYSWIPDPTVEVRRLNSKEFRLNNWLNNMGSQSTSQHSYRYRNVLMSPASFSAGDILADQAQPLLRELHYRAFERAYSVALNDPNLFVLNTPIHRIGYPPLSRQVGEVSVSYPADTLPEADPTAPWERKGTGTAVAAEGALLVEKTSSGPYPTGQPLFWTREVDLTFPCVYAATWRLKINSTTPDGVYTGISVGWSDANRVVVLGYLIEGGVRKIGFLKNGFGNRQASLEAWTGGVDANGNPTQLPFDFDWSILHSYRFFRDRDGVTRFYVDGEVVESLRITEEELPFLEELDDPFNEVQNAYFGSLSRAAKNLSTWDFVRYVVLPINPEQSAPSIFVSYEGDIYPETALTPWTPVGYHGNESLSNGLLLLDSTSATDASTSSAVGLMGGDFRGFTRIEPLLSASSDVTLDLGVSLRTYTHGVSSNSVMAALDDGTRLVQLCFFPSKPQPKLSYPGRSLPQDATPNPWTSLGTAPATMVGRILRIEDTTYLDGRVFAIYDLEPIGSDGRIIEESLDWYAEAKFQVISYTPDGSPDNNFCGATVDIFDGTRTIGIMTRVDPTTGDLQIAFHSDGQIRPVPTTLVKFNWFDGDVHVYRLVKNTSGNLVSLFIDNKFMGSISYSLFDTAHGDPTYSFGSSTLTSKVARSVVEWHYANVWRAQPASGVQHYLGIWKGSDSNSLLGYHLPIRIQGTGATAGNQLTDAAADFVATGVQVGDDLVIDYGVNRGVYSIASRSGGTLTITGSFPQPGALSQGYRIPAQTDWRSSSPMALRASGGGPAGGSSLTDTTKDFVALGVKPGDDLVIETGPNQGVFPILSVSTTVLTIAGTFPVILWSFYKISAEGGGTTHKFRLVRDPAGFVALFQDSIPEPLLQVDYSEVNLPHSSVGLPYTINRGLPSVSWGAFDPENLSQTAWDFVRYGVTRSPSELKIAPHHQVLNQRNVMSSPEHLFGKVKHNHTQYTSSSTGVPYPWEEYSSNPDIGAFTKLNEGTPLVPQTQTYEIRRPRPQVTFLATLNNPSDVLNTSGFQLNDASTEVKVIVPNDVLYNSLQVLEQKTGEPDLIAPFSDESGLVRIGKLSWQKTVCANYEGDLLPEQDPSYGTPWVLASETASEVTATVAGGILTYGVGPGSTTRTVYRNATPITDPKGLSTRVDFRLRLLNDATLGTGDSGVRFGFSALGMTAALAFVSTPYGEREVRLVDLNSNAVLGSISFDYLDGDFHVYRLVKNVDEGVVDFLIDP